jgi:hypothetical protein
MSKKIGVIAEDKSDVEVVTEILAKYMARNAFSVKQFVGNGCGKVKQKCDSWTRLLLKRGCEHVFLLHDLDTNDEAKLRKSLEKKLPPKDYPNSFIVIPIEEVEAWLLSDAEAIQKVFDLPKLPKRITNCESVVSPKEHLADVVWTIGRKRYVNTIHNKKISEKISLVNLNRCSSFATFDKYLRENVCN